MIVRKFVAARVIYHYGKESIKIPILLRPEVQLHRSWRIRGHRKTQ